MPKPKKVNSDPLMPKNSRSAYSFFVELCREEFKRKYPGEAVSFGEFSKRCSERWKSMTVNEKRRFVQMADFDHKRHQTEMAVYNSRPGMEKAKRAKKAKKVKDPNAPKRAMSAFFWFSQETRPRVKEANPSFSVGEISRELGRRWAEAAPEAKLKFESLAEKDRARYSEAKLRYQEKLNKSNDVSGGALSNDEDEEGECSD